MNSKITRSETLTLIAKHANDLALAATMLANGSNGDRGLEYAHKLVQCHSRMTELLGTLADTATVTIPATLAH